MANRLIIDGRDFGTYYGAFVTNEGLNALLSWPSAKKVDTVAWAEDDYVEADLSEIRLAAKEASIAFGMSSHPVDVETVGVWLASSIYRTWNIASVGRSYRLRFTGISGLTASQFLQSFSINTALDTPFEGYSYLTPVPHIDTSAEYSLDGVRLSEYGVRVLLGTLNSTALHPGVKERLKRDVSTINGVIYDGGATNTLREREITLKCALIDTTAAGAWRNYDALLYNLTRKNLSVAYDTDRCKRALYSQRLDRTFDCYYKSQSVTEFSPWGSRVWIVFDLHLGVVGEDGVDAYLATEAGAWVHTEDGYRIRI